MPFDFRDLLKYRRNLGQKIRGFEGWLHTFLLQEGMRFIAEVKPRTPVDTGDLRGHWKLDGITRVGNRLHVWFINPMHYALFVEYGHAPPYKSGEINPGQPGWVEGKFMMEISLDIIRKAMPGRYNAAWKAYWTK